MEEIGLMNVTTTQALRDCYRTIRAVEHRQTLQNKSGQVAVDELLEQRQQVQEIWRQFMLG